MIVIASMIGTPGLGEGILADVQRSEVGNGFVFGIGIVILAIIIDRFTQAMNRPNKTQLSKKKKLIIGAVLAILAILAIIITLLLPGNAGSSKGTITLAYAQQDDQVVSTNVITQVLEE